MSETKPVAKSLAIVTPGSSFPAEWLIEYDQTFLYIAHRFRFSRIYAKSNNIYLTRQTACQQVLADPSGVPDYVLWIDSDNPPRLEAFVNLMAQLEASERNTDPSLPPIDIIGGWYRYSNPNDGETRVAAGYGKGTRDGQLTESEIRRAAKAKTLIEDLRYIGFGLLLMRGEALARLGPQGFAPIVVSDARGFLTDDVSWCARAIEAGYRIYLHPEAFVEHLKFAAVPSAESKVLPISNSKDFVEERAS